MENRHTDPLKRPPVFGDVEQITALRKLRVEEENREGQTEYKIEVRVDFSENYTIWADNKEEAREEARDGIELGDYDIEIDITEV